MANSSPVTAVIQLAKRIDELKEDKGKTTVVVPDGGGEVGAVAGARGYISSCLVRGAIQT